MEEILEFFTKPGKDILSCCVMDDKENFIKLVQKNPQLINFPRMYEIACQNDSVNLVKYLWRFGLPIDIFILPALCLRGQLNMVIFFLINYDISKVNSISLLTCASSSGNLELVQYLVNFGFEASENENSAICVAALRGHYDIVKYFIHLGYDVHLNKNYLFRVACENGFLEIVNLLLENNFDFNSDQSIGVCLAAFHGHNNIIKLLFENGLDLFDDNFVAFYFAIKADNIDTLSFLIKLTEDKGINYETILQFTEKVKNSTGEYPFNCRLYIQTKLNINNTIDFPLDNVPSDDCPVCFNRSSLILSCRHSICVSCYQSLKDLKCPVCRYQIDKNLIKRKRE